MTSPMKALFLGIDIGTTKAKAVLFDEDGQELNFARRSTNPDCGSDGSAYQKMDLLWELVIETIREATHNAEQYGELKAIGVTAQGDGLWLLNEDGEPLGDATLWIDGRASSYIRKWSEENIIQKSGRVVFSGSPLALGAWYYDHAPEVMEKAYRLVFCKDWIKFCLTDEVVTDTSDLSDASIVDVWSRRYSKELLDGFGVGSLLDILPPIRPSDSVIGRITPKASRLTGLPVGLPVVNGMIDVAATALGNGVIKSMQACSIIGTTLYNEMVVQDLNGLELGGDTAPSIVCFDDVDRWLVTMGTMIGAPNLDWFINSFYGAESFDYGKMEGLMEKIGPGSGGVIYHPYIGQGGERAPFVKPSAAANFFGLKSHHTREHMLRAVYEGVAFSMKDCYSHFPVQPECIRLAGGGSVSDFWCQMFSNCVGKPIQVTYGNEIGARGAAALAAVGTGYFGSYKECTDKMVRVRAEYEPVLWESQVYEDNFGLYREIYNDIWNTWDRHHEIWKMK